MFGVLPLIFWIVLALDLLKADRSRRISSLINEISENNNGQETGEVFSQRVDHFDATNTRTFSQKFYYNADHLKSDGGKQRVLLFVGTNKIVHADDLREGFLVDMAREMNALIVGLEHRHYGSSATSSEYDMKELSTLTSQQALADIITFRWHIRKRFTLENDEWITVGGATAGNLAAWARIKFPHFVKASVASSAPVRSTVMFPEYAENLAEAFRNPAVGGSEKCLNNINMAFKAVDAAILTGTSLSKIQKQLSTCKIVSDYKDLQIFVMNLALPFAIVAENDGQLEGTSIRAICDVMTTEEKPIDMLASVMKYWMEISDQECISNTLSEVVKQLRSREPSNFKSICYQRCREFGYFMTCEKNSCVFSKLITPMVYTSVCQEAFGIAESAVPRNSRFTNDYYGAERPGGSRIIYTHGTIDPWRSLGVLRNNTESEIYSIIMKDVSQCRDIRSTNVADTPEITRAKRFILETLRRWFP